MPIVPVGKSVAALSEAGLLQLRDAVQSILSPAADGSITYSARALAFSASRP